MQKSGGREWRLTSFKVAVSGGGARGPQCAVVWGTKEADHGAASGAKSRLVPFYSVFHQSSPGLLNLLTNVKEPGLKALQINLGGCLQPKVVE